jgi:hypothetical protein
VYFQKLFETAAEGKKKEDSGKMRELRTAFLKQ